MNCTDCKLYDFPVLDIKVCQEYIKEGSIVVVQKSGCAHLHVYIVKEIIFPNEYIVVDKDTLKSSLIEADDITLILIDKAETAGLKDNVSEKFWAWVCTNMENEDLYWKHHYVRLKGEQPKPNLFEIIDIDKERKNMILGQSQPNITLRERLVNFCDIAEIIHWTYVDLPIMKLIVGGYKVSDKTISIHDIKPGDILVNVDDEDNLKFVAVTNINSAGIKNSEVWHIGYFIGEKDSLTNKVIINYTLAVNLKYKLSFDVIDGWYNTVGHLEEIVFD